MKKETKSKKVGAHKLDVSNIIVRPRITEKAAFIGGLNAYAFEIATWASKDQVSKAVKEIYKVTPVRVRTLRLPAKQVVVRGKKGTKSGVKKAYVYLKKGDKIELI